MSTPDHDRGAIGAYVLGQLDDSSAARVEAHLAGCSTCRAERDELLPAAGALADLKQSRSPAAADGAPPELGRHVLERVERERRAAERRRWVRSASIAAVAGAAAAVVVTAVVIRDEPAAAPRAQVPMETVPVEVMAPGVTASADLVAHTWGVEVKLSAAGFAPGADYRVTVLDTSGGRHAAGEFVGTGDNAMTCNLNSAVLRTAADGFEVRDAAGDVVARSRF